MQSGILRAGERFSLLDFATRSSLSHQLTLLTNRKLLACVIPVLAVLNIAMLLILDLFSY